MASSERSNRLTSAFRILNIAVLLLVILYIGKALFIPMSFGMLIAVICYPFCRWLESKQFRRSVAASVSMIIIVLLFGSMALLLIYEINLLTSSHADVMIKLKLHFPEAAAWLQQNTENPQAMQSSIVQRILGGLENNLGNTLNVFLSATASTLLSLILIPIFSYLFIVHRHVFVQFLESYLGPESRDNVHQILNESVQTYFRFVKGTFFVYCIVACLNSAGLLLLGIDHAVLFGMVAAFMTIIPYVGILISSALPITVALITKDSLWYAGGVVIVFSVVQYLEGNVIYPGIVGQQLNLSTLAVLVTLIAGTLMWGVAGMILFVPFAGLLKVISDRIPSLKPLNILLSRSESASVRKSNA